MNFCLGGEDVDKHASTRTCSYCGNVFDDIQTLDTHLWIHLNFPGRSCNSIENPLASPSSDQQSSTVANNPTLFRSKVANETSGSRSVESDHGVSQTQILMSPNGVTSHHNSSTLGALTAASGDALKMTQGPLFSSMGGVCQSERSLSMDGSKRPYVAENSGNAGLKNESEKTRIPPCAHAEPDILQRKEFPLLDNYVGSISGPADVDLSLRLTSEPCLIKELPLLNNFVELISDSDDSEDGAEDEDLSLHL